jgi:hypothetical protein
MSSCHQSPLQRGISSRLRATPPRFRKERTMQPGPPRRKRAELALVLTIGMLAVGSFVNLLLDRPQLAMWMGSGAAAVFFVSLGFGRFRPRFRRAHTGSGRTPPPAP